MSSNSIISPLASISPAVPSVSTVPASQQDGDPARVRFTNVEDLFDLIDRTTKDFLIVTHVSPRDFTKIEREREKRRRKFRFRRYDSNTRILFITIPTGIHEMLHLRLNQIVMRKIDRIGLWNAWFSVGAETFRPDHPRGDGGEGDSTGGPMPERSGGRWPTLVIEAGYSETLHQLHNDMQWWFRASNHDVKIVILAKFDYRQHHILLEKWEEEILYPQGAITRSRAAAISQQNGVLEPVKRQSITISRDETTNPVSYNVIRGALVLEFRLLFLREPGPQEGDVILSIQDLQEYAEYVWRWVL
ncbi:uncharacterized protein P884DRAFT_275171 [Thermothelomyces heterothallicus CBS 202.75]|uniref:uncharacterized protein n=1 Tax=Thermothelomyces heterothallicus CBS 202.75 TaxID=1149848 RepID=UPI003743D607